MSWKMVVFFVVFLLLLLLPGNIYLAYKSCFGPRSAEERGFVVEGDGNHFLCRWRSNSASVDILENNIVAVGAAANGSNFFWGVAEDFFVLTYNNTVAVDYNKDFLADYVAAPDGKRYIQMNGRLVSVADCKPKEKRFTLRDGRTFVWRDGRWQQTGHDRPVKLPAAK